MTPKWMEQIEVNLRLEWVITSMRTIITERRFKRIEEGEPETILLDDPRETELYGDSVKRIEILREFQFMYLQTMEENRLLERQFTNAFAKSVHLADENIRLKEEIEILKQNINF